MKRTIRLQKFLADCGICSRRKAEEHIKAGLVQVDGQTITAMGVSVDPEQQEVRFKGRVVARREREVTVLLHKPVGYVTTLSDPQGRPTVTELVKLKARLFPVGRLDLDTSGALLLTNNGQLAQKIQHPSFETTKTYEAVVQGRPGQSSLQRLARGIRLEGKLTAPARLRVTGRRSGETVVEITIHEGRKRQVRKMFKAIGHPVLSLKRLAYGRLNLGNLPPGAWRRLDQSEIKKIFLKKFPLQTKK